MLNGRPVLIVEEEFLIALDLQRMVEAMGGGPTLFARNAEEARAMYVSRPDIALAIVDLSFEASAQHALPAELHAAGIAVVVTSSDKAVLGASNGYAPLVVFKPIPEEIMASAVQRALAEFD